jgi:hypothetical protein
MILPCCRAPAPGGWPLRRPGTTARRLDRCSSMGPGWPRGGARRFSAPAVDKGSWETKGCESLAEAGPSHQTLFCAPVEQLGGIMEVTGGAGGAWGGDGRRTPRSGRGVVEARIRAGLPHARSQVHGGL